MNNYIDRPVTDCTQEELTSIFTTATLPPFCDRQLLLALAKQINAEARLTLFQVNRKSAAVLVYFKFERLGFTVFSSRGRYGFLGLVPLYPMDTAATSDIVSLFERFIHESDCDIATINLEPFNAGCFTQFMPTTHSHQSDSGVFICQLNDIFESSNEPSYMRNRSLGRYVKRGAKQGFSVKIEDDLSALSDWHRDCHLPRINEIQGLPWSLDFLTSMFIAENVHLFSIFNNQNCRIGGVIIVESKHAMELVMLSTPHQHMMANANYVLIDELHRLAWRKGLKYLNWQASNPPNGGVAEYKKKWQAFPHMISTYSFAKNLAFFEVFSNNDILEQFQETFVYDFSAITRN